MNEFMKKISKWALILGGLMTLIPGAFAVSPIFGMNTLLHLDFIKEYTILIQHWGFTVCLSGIFLILVAFKKEWRMPIVLFALFVKLYFVTLYVININEVFAKGFIIPVTSDLVTGVFCFAYVINEIRHGES